MADEKSEKDNRDFSRRAFIGAVAAVGAGAVMASCKKPIEPLTFIDKAPDGPPLKAALIGCGNRGTGAALNFLKAGPNINITLMADVLQDHMDACRAQLKEKANFTIPDNRCLIGFDAYKKVMESDVDLVICATPPHFRPIHFDAAVEAKKHCFLEKPAAVDAPGIRSLLATGQKAAAYNLCVVTGTQRRHDRAYQETYNHVSHGAIGQIVGAVARWNQAQLWYAPKKKEWSDMEAMIRDWVNWRWLSGDHIVEQHVHNLDTVLWFTGMNPTKVIGERRTRYAGDGRPVRLLQFAVHLSERRNHGKHVPADRRLHQ